MQTNDELTEQARRAELFDELQRVTEAYSKKGFQVGQTARRILEIMESEADTYEKSLEDIAGILGTTVERVVAPTGKRLTYANHGDTYGTTVAFDGYEFLVTSWGGWYEAECESHTEYTGETQCPNCSAWTDTDETEGDCGDCGYHEG